MNMSECGPNNRREPAAQVAVYEGADHRNVIVRKTEPVTGIGALPGTIDRCGMTLTLVKVIPAGDDVANALHQHIVRLCEAEIAVAAMHSRERVFARFMLRCAMDFWAPKPMPGDATPLCNVGGAQ